MEIKRAQLIPRGMQQDLSISKFNPEFSYENRNIRITARKDSALLSITNEKGNQKITNFVILTPNTKETVIVTVSYSLTIENYVKATAVTNIPIPEDLDINFEINGFYNRINDTWIVTQPLALYKGDTTKTVVFREDTIANYVEVQKVYIDEEIKQNTPWNQYNLYLIDTINGNNSDIIPDKTVYETSEFNGEFIGECIGYASLNNYIILFTHSDIESLPDRIYKIKDLHEVTLMFEGNLNFSKEHLIDTLPIYESESVQKVYWTDSYNQPRVINFTNDPEPNKWSESTYFDFSPAIAPYSSINVTKNNSGGEFAPGAIQYAFTYVTDWHGVETNVVDISNIYYISYENRGAKEDETCYNSFNIRLAGLDPRYKYVRIYSIQRTSLNTTPTVKILGEYPIQNPTSTYQEYWALKQSVKDIIQNSNIYPYSQASWSQQLPKLHVYYDQLQELIVTNFGVNIGSIGNGVFTLQDIFNYIWNNKSYYVEIVDTGLIGTNDDTTSILYKNSSEAIVSTMVAKDSTLFVGGYTIPSEGVSETEEIKLYQEYGSTIVAITVTTIDEPTPILTITASEPVTSNVVLDIEWNESIVKDSAILAKGTDQLDINRTVDNSIYTLKSISIRKADTEQYYSDISHVYYLKDIDSYPTEELVLKGSDGSFEWGYRDFVTIEDSQEIGTYTYHPYTLKDGSICKQFKKGQPYRFALQGQYTNGRWGDPILIKNLEDIWTLIEKDSEIITNELESSYELDNICTNSFLLDVVETEETTPQYLLTDIIYKNNDFNLKVSPSFTTSSIPPFSAEYWYVPSNCYIDDGNTVAWNDKSRPNPWIYIYNKDSFTNWTTNNDSLKTSLINLPIADIANQINFKVSYKVNNKYFNSMWVGNLTIPQTITTVNHREYPQDMIINNDAVNIDNNNFDGKFTSLYLNKLSVHLSKDKCKELYNKGYRRIRLLYVEPTAINRKYPAQGIVTNTIFWPKLRATNSCWAYTDYLSRPKEVYRVWNEQSEFFKRWFVKEQILNISNAGNNRITASPYFYPLLHHFYTDPECLWELRPNYGHLMSVWNEIAKQERTVTVKIGTNDHTTNFCDNTGSSFTSAFPYKPSDQLYNPLLNVSVLEADTDTIFFDESIIDFWSPDIEYNESNKNYFENTIEGFKVRGMSCIVSTNNSNYTMNNDATVYGLLGYADTTNYQPFTTVDSLIGKGIAADEYSSITQVKYLPNPQLYDISSSVHRTILGSTGSWSVENAKSNSFRKGSILWDNLGTGETENRFNDKIFSFKKYCLNTLLFKDLDSLYYNINTPSLFIKGDSIKPISLYKTTYSGEDVTYNAGMNELLLNTKNETNIPIQYNANTHLTFSLTKGKLASFTKDNELNIDTQKEAYPVMPELSAWAKFHDNQQIIGQAGGELVYINIYWWPSKSSIRPDIYSNESYSVSDSFNKGEGKWKIAIEASKPLPVTISIKAKFELGFWKSGNTSKYGQVTITLPAGKTSAIKKFKQDFTTLYNWSTIHVDDYWFVEGKIGNWTRLNKHTITSNTATPTIAVLVDNNTYINSEQQYSGDPYWLGNNGVYVKDLFDPIQEEILSSEYDNVGINSIIYHRNLPHFLLVDLVRSDAYIYSDWTENSIYQQIWIPCGNPVVLPIPELNEGCIVEATEGDVYIGRYDCLRVCSNNESKQRVNDIVSFICESYINPDGRTDVNRYITDTRTVNFDNFNTYNSIYSQSNNFFSYNKNDYRVLEQSGKFPNQFSWTLPKQPDNLVDNWANLTFASTYNLDGEYGKLTKLVMHNNQLYAFQDKAISNILFNTRVQIPVSDGLPIELANSNKVDGVRYISTSSGAQNKWSIITSRSGIYYIDHYKKNFNLISSEGIKDITSTTGFTSWALNNLGYSVQELNLLDGMSNWKLSNDSIHNDIYIHDKDECLNFSERLANFTSFFDYKDIPFMFRHDRNFLSVYSKDDITTLYKQNTGIYNTFFDTNKVTSYIDYIINPDMPLDKVFNNIEFRADAFNGSDYLEYVPSRTFDHIHVWNEFQDSNNIELTQYKNLQKKFRVWRAYIPRDAKEFYNGHEYRLNRIRNPWIHLKLSYTPTEEEDNKLVLHDLIINYTI